MHNYTTKTDSAQAVVAAVRAAIDGRTPEQRAALKSDRKFGLVRIDYGDGDVSVHGNLSKAAKLELMDIGYYGHPYQAFRNAGGGVTVVTGQAGTMRGIRISRNQLDRI